MKSRLGISSIMKMTKEERKSYQEEQRIIVGNRLRRLREENGMSQREVSEILGLETQAAYGKLEGGNVTLQPHHCVILAELFGKSCDYIMRGVEAQNVDVCKRTGLEQKSIEALEKFEKERQEHLAKQIFYKNKMHDDDDSYFEYRTAETYAKWYAARKFLINALIQDDDYWRSILFSTHDIIDATISRFCKERDQALNNDFDSSIIDDNRTINGCKYVVSTSFMKFFDALCENIDFLKCTDALPEDVPEMALLESFKPGWKWLDYCPKDDSCNNPETEV